MAVYRSRLILNNPNKKEYTFLSRGANGIVKKIVELERFPGTNVFNVLLIDDVNGTRLNDSDMTGNNDAIKVINTVVHIIEKFLNRFPGNQIYISGNTHIKKMMYQRKVYLIEVSKYVVFANRRDGDSMELIERPVNSRSVYNAFLVFLA